MLKVFGHQNPDMDSIASAMAAAHYLRLRDGIDAKACRIGILNKEAKFAMEYFEVSKEEIMQIETLQEGENVCLVDHNEFSQSVSNIENAVIKMVIDHHKIDHFKTKEPLEYIAKPVGCTCTILYDLLKSVDGLQDRKINGMMLSAILSDTLLLKSPTTTQKDKEVVTNLAEMLNINIEQYGLSLLKAGADLSELSAKELICVDAKIFENNGIQMEVNQINAVDLDNVLSRQKEIESEMQKEIQAKNLAVFMVVVTDIINCNSEAIVLGKDVSIFEKAFQVTLENNRAFLKGVVSRKKQIIPNLMNG